LVPLEPVEIGKGAALDVVVFEKMPVLPQIGDTIDLDTGVVTKFVPQIITQKDPVTDLDIQVSAAPEVKLATDVAPKAEGTVSTKEGDTTKDVTVEGGK
jgi:hypothetical protein